MRDARSPFTVPQFAQMGDVSRALKKAADLLHPDTLDLVARFAIALALKLQIAQGKYGYSNGWKNPGWADECRVRLLEHIVKGDPRDVAAYCAFLWWHGEFTGMPDRAFERTGVLRIAYEAYLIHQEHIGAVVDAIERPAPSVEKTRCLVAWMLRKAADKDRDGLSIAADYFNDAAAALAHVLEKDEEIAQLKRELSLAKFQIAADAVLPRGAQ